MKWEELEAIKKDCLDKVEEFRKKTEKAYWDAHDLYLSENCKYEEQKVYDLDVFGAKRKKLNRFVIYKLRAQAHGRHSIIQAGGWWLNSDSVPEKWDTLCVGGKVWSPTKLKLSEDQTHFPHPDSKEAKKKGVKS